MLFNLNEFLMAVSFALDFVEMDILGVTSNHGKRTAYTALRIAKELGFKPKELHDIVALAILHDNGASEKSLRDSFYLNTSIDVKSVERIKEHCTIGEDNIIQYPFLTEVKNVIKYHHERYDGNGLFQIEGEDIPLMAQIIYLADVIEVNYDLEHNDYDMQQQIKSFTSLQKGKMFSYKVVSAFHDVTQDMEYWNHLKEDKLTNILKNETPEFSFEIPVEDIKNITGVLSKIIDAKSRYTQMHSSDLSQKAEIMADFYQMDHEVKLKFIIAANLHDIGKLAVPNRILDKPSQLTNEEFDIIKKHPYLTRLALQEIKGFEDITEWASNHHEKLDGTGYPLGKSVEELDFNSRLLACLDIYEALTEDRPYRKSLGHVEAMNILYRMKDNDLLDAGIIRDMDFVFGR
jgi:HD-GYP domain-containing protein (c-di-GMP phosphodiesterase class II)